MLNHITIAGRLTKDVELRHTSANIPVASFTIACERDFKDNSGNKTTDFVDCVAWRNTAEFVGKYFIKGQLAIVSGRLQIRDYEDKEGKKRKVAEVVADNVYFGGDKKESKPVTDNYAEIVEDDGKIPF